MFSICFQSRMDRSNRDASPRTVELDDHAARVCAHGGVPEVPPYGAVAGPRAGAALWSAILGRPGYEAAALRKLPRARCRSSADPALRAGLPAQAMTNTDEVRDGVQRLRQQHSLQRVPGGVQPDRRAGGAPDGG